MVSVVVPLGYKFSNYFNIIAEYCGVPVNVSESDSAFIPSLQDKDGNLLVGFSAVSKAIARESQKSQELLGASSPDTSAWIERMLNYADEIFQEFATYDVKVVYSIVNDMIKANPILVGDKITIADIVLYLALHNSAVQFTPQERRGFSRCFRWFDNIQQSINSPLERVVVEQNVKHIKEKKAPAEKRVVEEIDPISYLDIRVGKILSVKPHPDADSLYIEDIDIGEGVTKKVVTGVRKFIPIEQMQDRVVAVFCNIPPSKLKGQPSEAMVFAASVSEPEEKVELLEVPEGTPVGTRILFGDFCKCDPSPCDKRCSKWNKCKGFVGINENGVATYKGQPLHVPAGPLTVPNLRNCEFH